MVYNFTAQWVKGCKNDAPNALLRNPVLSPQRVDMLAEYDPLNHPEMSTVEIKAITDANPSSKRLEDLRYHAAQDPEYQHIQELVFNGFPDHRSQVHQSCRCYWNAQEHLSIDDNLIVHGCCLLILTAM